MNVLFQNKTKNIVAASFAALFVAVSIGYFDFASVSLALDADGGWRYVLNALVILLISLVAPVSLLVCCFTPNNGYRLKRWLLPVAFGVHLLRHLFVFITPFSSIVSQFKDLGDNFFYNVSLLLTSGAALVANVLVFLGFLLNNKPLWLLRVGSLLYVVSMAFFYIIDFVNAGGLAYYQHWEIISAAIIRVLVPSVAATLFYVGLFLLSTNKPTSLDS